MAMIPSITDIISLSTMAWKIGRAFTKGRKSAPEEFGAVERECTGLSKALKLVAEAFHTDGSVLGRADDNTQSAVATILDSANRTLSDLESFVENYQVVKRRETNGEPVGERSWSEVVVAHYKTLKWTSEGGDLNDLRTMLNAHTNTINLTMQALQSRSLSRLEKTVMPMAENVASLHDHVTGDLSDKLDDVHRIIMAVANSTPSLGARDIDTQRRLNIAASSSNIPAIEQGPINDITLAGNRMLEVQTPPTFSERSPARLYNRRASERTCSADMDWRRSTLSKQSLSASGSAQPGRSGMDPQDSAYCSIMPVSLGYGGALMDRDFETGLPPDVRSTTGDHFDDGDMEIAASSSAASSGSLLPGELQWRRGSNVPRWESITLSMSSKFPYDAASGSDRGEDLNGGSLSSTPINVQSSKDHIQEAFEPKLPPSAMAPGSFESGSQQPATPLSILASPHRQRKATDPQRHSFSPRSSTPSTLGERTSVRTPQPLLHPSAPTFEKSLLRNSAILCDVRSKTVEYLQALPDEPDPRHNTEMVETCTESRIWVIRKRENGEQGGTRVVTSIWALSDDGTVRCQQKLSEWNETVPYCSYFQPEKVSLASTEGEMDLRFHAETWGDVLEKEVKTRWVNYIFHKEEDATSFQSAIFGRQLLGSFQTQKTTVVHEGLKGAFAFEEQFANIETLRLWEDDGVTTPSGQGGVLALMHFGSNFGEGWARWWMNNATQQVTVKDEGGKFAKLKGLDVRTIKPGSTPSTTDKTRSFSSASDDLKRRPSEQLGGPRRKSSTAEKRVTGIKIEFKTEKDKVRFIAMVKKVQGKMLPLPDP